MCESLSSGVAAFQDVVMRAKGEIKSMPQSRDDLDESYLALEWLEKESDQKGQQCSPGVHNIHLGCQSFAVQNILSLYYLLRYCARVLAFTAPLKSLSPLKLLDDLDPLMLELPIDILSDGNSAVSSVQNVSLYYLREIQLRRLENHAAILRLC